MERIYGKIYNKKRLAPGGVTRSSRPASGTIARRSAAIPAPSVLDLDNGEALGLHFSGSFLATNYAVRADVVKKLLGDVRAGARGGEAPRRRPASSADRAVGDARPSTRRRSARRQAART